ncbi:Hypothetical predicted protein [Octopus vulgaris]|uniref:Uncharacterized protein n=1 Tax=Octopus vulgaris TaxID=6645 RepID=A0AA36BLI9_OCTVU|nr:Hypothetical predicted protein [Octopus vulgaris]
MKLCQGLRLFSPLNTIEYDVCPLREWCPEVDNRLKCRCRSGSEGRVCGYEMQFYNCADIAFDKLIPNNGAEEEETKLQNTRKNGKRRKKRNALRLSSKICKPNEICRQRSAQQSLFSKNDSSSVGTKSISAPLLMSENLLASHGALHENRLSMSEPGSASGHYLNLLEPSDFSDYGSGDVQSGDHRSNAFSVEPSTTILDSQKLNAINQIRKKGERQKTATEPPGSFSDSLVSEELLPITAPPQLSTKNNYSGAEKTNNSLDSSIGKTNTMVSSKIDETNKQLTATEKIDLTIIPTTAIRQHSSGTNDSIPKRSDTTKTKEENNCTDDKQRQICEVSRGMNGNIFLVDGGNDNKYLMLEEMLESCFYGQMNKEKNRNSEDIKLL